MRQGISHADDQCGGTIQMSFKRQQIVVYGLDGSRFDLALERFQEQHCVIYRCDGVPEISQWNGVHAESGAEIDSALVCDWTRDTLFHLKPAAGNRGFQSTGHPEVDGCEVACGVFRD
jgi:hypothetical protein